MRELALEIFERALARMDPERLVWQAADSFPDGRVRVLALGKAALKMARGAAQVLGDRLVDGLVVSNVEGNLPDRFELVIGSHPVPNVDSERAGRALLARAAEGGVDAICTLVSGGASAIAAVPAPGLRLAEKVEALRRLYAAGAPIAELNCARKHLSAIKGGKLAAAASAPVTSLILSDVVGDDLSVVGSGPTVPDRTTAADALAIFDQYLGVETLAESVQAALQYENYSVNTGQKPNNILLAGITDAVNLFQQEAAVLGPVESMGASIQGDVAEVADMLVKQARKTKVAAVGGGEATIALPPDPGIGGRAQQLALLVAKQIAGLTNVTVLIAGTDGIDGNSSAAGAIVTGATWNELATAGINGDEALARFDAGTALARVGAAVVTGPTGVNHADLMLILRGQR